MIIYEKPIYEKPIYEKQIYAHDIPRMHVSSKIERDKEECPNQQEKLFEIAPVPIYLTWQGNPSTTMSIQWIAPANDTEDFVEYFMEPSSLHESSNTKIIDIPGLKSYKLYQNELTNLKQDTEYSFRIGRNGKTYKFQ